jgi:hypothetical protein
MKPCMECGKMMRAQKWRPKHQFCSRKCYRGIGHRIANYRIAENGCFEWSGSRDRDGYGILRLTINGKVEQRAHRLSWIHFKGVVPEFMQVLHRCDNPGCVNPDHLFLGTNHENMLDKTRKKRNNTSKLTKKDVLKIRTLHAIGVNQRRIADRFSVGYKAVNKIVLRQRWKHV